MKKIIALLMAVLCICSVFCFAAFAADDVISPENNVKIISGVEGPGGGKITPPSSSYKPGDDVIFHIIPDKGYKIKQVWVNGVAIGPVSEYEFKNIQSDSTIYVEFEKISDETTKPAKPDNGNVSPKTGVSISPVVFGVLGTMGISGIAAILIAKGRKEEY